MSEREEEEKGSNITTQEMHFKCMENKDFKKNWEAALERGQVMECPGCGS